MQDTQNIQIIQDAQDIQDVSCDLEEYPPHLAKLSSKGKMAVRLHAVGYSIQEISAITKLSQSHIRKLIAMPESQAYLEHVLGELEQEFRLLYGKVVQALRECLMSDDGQLRIAAANLWLRTTKEQRVKVTVTAEDVIRKLYETPQQLLEDASEYSTETI